MLARMDTALSLKDTAKALGYAPSTFRALLKRGYGERWGLVELPRPNDNCNRRFSAASVDRVISGTTGIVLKSRNRRAS